VFSSATDVAWALVLIVRAVYAARANLRNEAGQGRRREGQS